MGLVWLSGAHAQTPELLEIVTDPDAIIEQAAKDAVGNPENYEGFVRWGIVRADIRTIAKYDKDISQSTAIETFTLSPFPEYRFFARKASYETDTGYLAVWEGTLESRHWFGGGRIFVYVSQHCEGQQVQCFMIHTYPDSGILDRLIYERVIGIWATELLGVYVVLETKRNNFSYWWKHRNYPPYS
jgi:hypothetical protein